MDSAQILKDETLNTTSKADSVAADKEKEKEKEK